MSSSLSSPSSSWITFGLLVVALVVAVVLLVHCIPKSKSSSEEKYADYNAVDSSESSQPHAEAENENILPTPLTQQSTDPSAVQAAEPLGDNEVPYSLEPTEPASTPLSATTPKDCFPKDQLTPGELLPSDANSKWAQSVPAGQGSLGDGNFLSAGFHVGINTVGQSLRNANLQLRSEPPNPQINVGPWNTSTIGPDTNRKPLEIGGC